MSDGPGDRDDKGAKKTAIDLDRDATQRRALNRFRFTVNRPVAILMVFLAAVVFGGFSLVRLPLTLMPDISYPKLTVRTEYPGAAPAEVENDVARPLEEVLGVVTGVTRVSSISRAGFADVVLEFTWDTDMDDAGQDVLEKLDAIRSNLPEEIESPLILRYDPTLDPVLVLSVSGKDDQLAGISGLKTLRRISERGIRRQIEPLDGVAAIKIKGGLEEEIHIELDQNALRRTNTNIQTIIDRLAAENINLAGGSMLEGKTRYLVRTVNEFHDLDEIREMVVSSREGRDIKLRDLASVQSSFKDRDVLTRSGGQEAVEIEVFKEADANIVAMAQLVRKKIDEELAERMDKEHGIVLQVVADRSTFIKSSIAEVRSTALFGGVLAVIVLFLFLRDLKTTLIVALAIPLSVVMTFAPLHLATVSLNIMSLGGFALGIGMLVDNSIVVLESIHRCREEGDHLVQATIRGTSEVGTAVLASTLTTVAVFFPMVFVEGVAGQMFGDLGITVVFSLLASLAVALFFIPMLASRQAPSGEGRRASFKSRWSKWMSWKEVREGAQRISVNKWMLFLVPYFLAKFFIQTLIELLIKVVSELVAAVGTTLFFTLWLLAKVGRWLTWPLLAVFDKVILWLVASYRRVIRFSLKNAWIVYLAICSVVAIIIGRGVDLDTELIPELHQGELRVDLSLPVGTPLAETDRVLAPIESLLKQQIPQIDQLVTTIGSERDNMDAGNRGEHTARIALTVKRRGGREESAEPSENLASSDENRAQRRHDGDESQQPTILEIEERAIEVIRSTVSQIPGVQAEISRPVLFSFKNPVELEVRGYALEKLASTTDEITRRLSMLPELRDVRPSIYPGSPEVQIIYDRDKLARLSLDVRKVAELVRNKIQGIEATKFNKKERKIPIRVRLADVEHANLRTLHDLVVNPGMEHAIPLSAVAEIKIGRGPNEIRRIGQTRVGLVTANLQGVGLGAATSKIARELDEIQLESGVSVAITGQNEEWETSSQSLYLALGLSVFLVYVIMASQFESLIHPLIILISIPLAFLGVVVALDAVGLPISIVVGIGVIMLAGIVVNNAIVLVDYINQLKLRGHPTLEAIEIAGVARLRPILMTTLTTVLGLLPMALGLGDGAEIRRPMAITVISGLGFSTLLTLVVIPILYAGADRLLRRPGLTIPVDVELESQLREAKLAASQEA